MDATFEQLLKALKLQAGRFSRALQGKERVLWDKLQESDDSDALQLGDNYYLRDELLRTNEILKDMEKSVSGAKGSYGAVQTRRAQIQADYITSMHHGLELRYKTRLQMLADSMSRRSAQEAFTLDASVGMSVAALFNIKPIK